MSMIVIQNILWRVIFRRREIDKYDSNTNKEHFLRRFFLTWWCFDQSSIYYQVYRCRDTYDSSNLVLSKTRKYISFFLLAWLSIKWFLMQRSACREKSFAYRTSFCLYFYTRLTTDIIFSTTWYFFLNVTCFVTDVNYFCICIQCVSVFSAKLFHNQVCIYTINWNKWRSKCSLCV